MSFPVSNNLLDMLPPEERAALLPHLEAVSLPMGTVLFEAEERPRYVHFVTAGMASIVTPMSDGTSVEVGVVGREGLVEAMHLLGPGQTSTRCFLQVAGSGLRMNFNIFEERFFRDGMMRLALRYAQYQSHLLSQIAACNRHHEVEERLARWLLMVEDRIGSPDLRLTQEFLASMLGSRRSTVTVMAGTLQRSGLIRYQRGHVNILDRESLESVACECYAVTKRLFDDLSKKL